MDMENGKDLQRINKVMAASGLCSRRKADELIKQGKVRVDGLPVFDPVIKIPPSSTVEVDGQLLKKPSEHIYIMINKPPQTICTMHDPQNRTKVVDLLPKKLRQARVFPVGRLDYFSEGLLLLTNDGNWANQMSHPSYEHKKIYEVIIRGKISEEARQIMSKGMQLKDGTKLLPADVAVRELSNQSTLLTITLYQGLNRQIRRMCADLNLVILKLKRIAAGPLRLGDLPTGKWRYLTDTELDKLQTALSTDKNLVQ